MALGIFCRKIKTALHTLLQRLGPIKYALLVMLLGILFLLPTKKEVTTESVISSAEIQSTQLSHEILTEEKIAQILSQMHGAGKVTVMLTVKNDGRTEYQSDAEYYSNGSQSESKIETVFSGSSGTGNAVISSQSKPEFMGALILAQGADSANVRLQITKAVCCLTGLSSDKVTVLKMK